MEVDMAKQQILRAGHELSVSGLIVRTWGNISCRIDDKTFAITPSGRSYETLTKEEIVLCRIEDASYDGEIKPSSEKGIHAMVYRTFPEVNFVIHTHQPVASAISASGITNMPSENSFIGDSIPVAGYGLPGTKKLKDQIAKALTGKKCKAVIMAHHGALCFGKNYEETFAAARQLEASCSDHIRNSYLKMSSQVAYVDEQYYNYYISVTTGKTLPKQMSPVLLHSSRRTEDGFIMGGETGVSYRFKDTIPAEAQIHKAIYLKRPDINYIIQDLDKSLHTISLTLEPLRPLLDDFAQIVGSSAQCATSAEPGEVVKALGKRMGVIVPGCGALCCSATESDLQAVKLVMEKDAYAQISTQILGGGQSIGWFDCKLMHFVYTKSYSKKV